MKIFRININPFKRARDLIRLARMGGRVNLVGFSQSNISDVQKIGAKIHGESRAAGQLNKNFNA